MLLGALLCFIAGLIQNNAAIPINPASTAVKGRKSDAGAHAAAVAAHLKSCRLRRHLSRQAREGPWQLGDIRLFQRGGRRSRRQGRLVRHGATLPPSTKTATCNSRTA